MNFNVLLIFIINGIIGFDCVRRTVSSRNWPQSDQPEYEIVSSKAVWMCDFTRDDCGIINDPNVGQFFKVKTSQTIPIDGKATMIAFNITEINSHPSGARLITPYFPTKHYLKGCLSSDYLIRGNGVQKLMVYQQDKDNHCVWQISGLNSRVNDNWKKLSLTIDLKNGDPRFFIESHIDNRPPNTGFIAFTQMKFFYGSCDRNDANNCVKEESDESTDYPNDLP